MSEIVLRDAAGRVLNVGDRVIQTNGEPPVFTIVDVKPMLERKAPKDGVWITLQQTVKLPTRDTSVLPDFLRFMTAAEQGIEGEKVADPDAEKSPEKKTNLVIP